MQGRAFCTTCTALLKTANERYISAPENPLDWSSTNPQDQIVFRLLLLLSLAVSPAAAQTIEVALTAELPPDSQLGLRGNTDPLSWEESLLMTDPDGDGTYTATLTFPPAAGTVEYKAAVTAADGTLSWESGANRLLIPGRMTVERRALNGPQTDLPILEISAEELRADAELLW